MGLGRFERDGAAQACLGFGQHAHLPQHVSQLVMDGRESSGRSPARAADAARPARTRKSSAKILPNWKLTAASWAQSRPLVRPRLWLRRGGLSVCRALASVASVPAEPGSSASARRRLRSRPRRRPSGSGRRPGFARTGHRQVRRARRAEIWQRIVVAMLASQREAENSLRIGAPANDFRNTRARCLHIGEAAHGVQHHELR